MNPGNDFVEALSFVAVFAVIIYGLTWVLRTVVDYRRWSRQSRVQTEVHSKLLDRFTNMEDLQAYYNSPAGRRFLESAPIEMDSAIGMQGVPAGRILRSLQTGVVLALGGGGLHFAVRSLTEPEAAEPLRVMGTIAIALGIGFVLSAGASFILSQRLGLLAGVGKNAPRDRSD